uniref:Nck-associated protein 5 n=1 Tax=Larimichthys crocea TaxID=215358 RepID=A0A0F8AZ08_LARCR
MSTPLVFGYSSFVLFLRESQQRKKRNVYSLCFHHMLECLRRRHGLEKLAVARLQREVARSKSEGTMREKLIHELEEERRLRLESEKRLREVTEESELGRAQMVSLQQQFSSAVSAVCIGMSLRMELRDICTVFLAFFRKGGSSIKNGEKLKMGMEETVRSLLQNQTVVEQTAVDTVDIMKAYKDKLSEEVQKQHDGPEENGSPQQPQPATQTEPDPARLQPPPPPNADPDEAEEDKDKTKPLMERLKALEMKHVTSTLNVFIKTYLAFYFILLRPVMDAPPGRSSRGDTSPLAALCINSSDTKMEETVRSLLQNQTVVEQTAVDTVDIMKAYKDKLSEEVQKQHDGPEENGSPQQPQPATQTEPDTARLQPPPPPNADPDEAEEDKDKTKPLMERLKALEEQNSALASENESQREQYERCLDEVANQVVQALLTQKDLREECLKLRTRVFDLEQQNRALSVLFQQRIKPASDLLLQKLHSRIMDLSAADLLLEPERSKAFLLSRNTDSPSNEVQLNGKAGLPVAKCLSQLSLTVPAPVYPRSSCSSSELSLSSACSEFSSGSYTWNDGRSCEKMSSLTWEKRLSLGSSAPSNICAALEEQQPTRRKESHILEGLRKLQRRKHRSSSASFKVSKSGDKDCMNSNEGIYSLGIKSSSKGVSKPTHVGRNLAVGSRKFSYDSDDADDELAHSRRGDNIPTKDSWFYCKRLSHSISDSLCSWEGIQDSGGGGDGSSGAAAVKHPSGYDSKERPEKLMSFINSFLPEGGRTSAFTKPSMLHFNPSDPEGPNHLSDVDDPEELNSESSDMRTSFSQPPERAERDSKRLSRDAAKLITQQWLRRDQGRTQSADGRPRPFSLIKEPKVAKCTQSEESILAIFDAEGEPIELCTGAGSRNDIQGSKVVSDYTELVPQERPTRQKSGNARNYSVLESPEKLSEHQIRSSKTSNSREGSAERLSMQLTPQRKLIKPPSSRSNKRLSIPPMNDPAGPKSSGSKIPGRNKPSGSPLRTSKDSINEPSNNGNSGPCVQEKSPSSPTVKISRFIKTPGTCSQSPKAVNSKISSRVEWNKGSSSSSPHLPRRHLEYADNGEQPTRDKHCETSKNKLRSPSPPPPPGRTTSLLIRPNYEGSPQAHKTWVAQPSTPTTVRGPPPSYHTSVLPNMQTTLPIKDKDCLELDAGYGTALAPQKLVDKASQHLQKSPATTQTPTKGTSKRMATKDYLPSANSGCAPETENAPKSSKNVPPPYSALRGSSFASKRGSGHENVHHTVQKTSISLPITLQDPPQGKTEPQSGKSVVSPPSSVTISPEKGSKTRIPMGFKAFLKSPPSHKNSPSIPGKQEKDHINSVSKETVTSNASTQCDSLQPACIDPPPNTSITEGKGEVQCRLLEKEVLPEEGDVCDKGKRNSQLFSRSISVTTKPHLKPALGMNGAKARSQSFSTNYIEKPNINALDGPGKIRTQIITNSSERGNSLSRQSSLEVPSVGLAESPVHSPRTRLSYYAGMTGSNSHNILPDRTSKSGSKGEGSQATVKGETVTSPSQKEVRSLPISDRIGLNILKPAKVASHPQFQPPSSCVYSSENLLRETAGTATTPNEPDFSRDVKTQTDSPNKAPDMEEKKISPTVCTIEEKVMMGIEQNLQKCQEQEKVAANEAKQKTGPSLANWFGLRKSKLPALSGGKKADSPKGKEEKKELKIGSVLGGKQVKSDKKKDKKKNDSQQKDSQEAQNLSEVNNKLSSIMDHCNNQMGQIASQIHCTTAFIGKDQFVKELLGRTAVKGNSVVASPPGISTPKKHGEMKGDMEICPDTATLLMTQKINLRAENEEGRIAGTTCQDHMIGSGCQMRTLDSGIGTFPLPDSVTRAGGRHIPKSESSPDRVTAGSSELSRETSSSHPEPSRPDVKVPSLPKTRLHAPTSMGHSLSDPSVTCSSNNAQDTQSRLPKLATTDAIRTKRLSLGAPRSNTSTEDKEKERKVKNKDHNMSGERALQVCTYSGSSSDTETELEGTGSTLVSPQRTLIYRAKKSDSVDQNEETLKRSSVEKPLSIMDYYQHDVFSHLEKDSRRISQYNLLHKESSLDGKAGDRLSKEIPLEKTPVSANQPPSLDFSLESLNKLNHSSSCSGSLYPDAGLGSRRDCHADAGKSVEDCCKVDEPSSSSFSSKPGADPVGSLSDSLYDSFSSCTSQGSNDV